MKRILVLLLLIAPGCISLTNHNKIVADIKKADETERKDREVKAFEDGVIEGVYRASLTLKASTDTAKSIEYLDAFVMEQNVRRRR